MARLRSPTGLGRSCGNGTRRSPACWRGVRPRSAWRPRERPGWRPSCGWVATSLRCWGAGAHWAGRWPSPWSERAAAHVQAISAGIFEASLPAKYPPVSISAYRSMKLTAEPGGIGLSWVREEYSAPLNLLLGVAGLVLLIACANLANLMLARAS